MSDRSIGWTLLLGSPGVAAGLAITALAAAHLAGATLPFGANATTFVGGMALAGIGSAAGASRFTPSNMTDEAFTLVSVGAIGLGAVAYFLMLTLFNWAWWVLTS